MGPKTGPHPMELSVHGESSWQARTAQGKGFGEPPAELLRPGNAGSNTATDQFADLELRHRLRAAKDTDPVNLPLHAFNQNRIRWELLPPTLGLTAWIQILALSGHDAHLWDLERLRLLASSG